MVGKRRHRAAQRLHDLDLGPCVGDMVRAAHNVGYTHFGIVHYAGQRVQNLAIATDQHGIRH